MRPFSRIAVAIPAVLVGVGPRTARADDTSFAPPTATQVGVEDLVDMVGTLDVYTVADPVSVAGVVRASSGSTAFGASASTYGARIGKNWGRADVLETRFTALADGKHTSFIVPVDLLRVEAQYLCRAQGGGPSFVWPVATDLLASQSHSPPCTAEWLGYYMDLLSTTFRPDLGHIGLRALDGGVFANLLDTGRTPRAFRDFAIVRAGASADFVAFGSTPRPADAGSTTWAARGEIGARIGISTADEVFRVAIDGDWRPRIGVWDDEELEENASATVFIAPSYSLLLGIGLNGGLAQASRPWTTTSEWSDPRSRWSAMGQLTLDLYWSLH
jgi:hypothetical protein